MDFGITAEQEALRDLAREILEDRVTDERLRELASDADRFDRELWRELAKANLIGASLPEEVGGSGCGLIELCLLLHEIGRAVAPVPLLATLAYCALPIARFGTEAQRRRYLRPVSDGDAVLTAAFSEAESEDPLRPSTTARRDGASWRLDGSKTCVPVAHLAEGILVPARVTGDSVGLFLLDPHATGVELVRSVATTGEPQFRVDLSGARVSEEDALGDPRAGVDAIRWVAERATIAVCAEQLGAMERMLEMTAAYTTERRQFDRPIGSFQAVHQRAADAYIDVEALRLTMWEAAWCLEAERPASEQVLIAKYWASEPAYRVAYACAHLHGGIGIDMSYPLHRYYLWIKQHELTLGHGTHQLRQLGRLLADAPPQRLA